ncbi:MAG: hypothetical protein KDH17_11180 [Rhodocyclaceae bacterium]|nr:hypothetical protein [Rhodocyclaceae bacterium]
MNPDLDHLQAGLIAALAAQIAPGRGLFDPHSRQTSPPDHYGQTAAALALAAHDRALWPTARNALAAWIAIDDAATGHLPFNRLLLRLLERVAADTCITTGQTAPIPAAAARCTLQQRYPSNNWTLLAQTCRLIEAPERERAGHSARLGELFDRWTTPAGAFIDFPDRPGKHFSTPIAYHHKALFLAALAAWHHDDPALANHARRMLDWLVHCWDPAGYAGGHGRSNHALFGDGCLLGALILLGFDRDDPASPVTALARRIEGQRRPDGLLWLTPSGAETGDASWDGYMHLSVYNAWTAAVIAIARHLRRHATRPHQSPALVWNGSAHGCFHDAEAGILYLRTSTGLNAMVVTRGQPPQSFSREEADFRYAGGLVVHLSRAGIPLLAPPVRCSRSRLLAAPALAAWTPVLQYHDKLFALTDFDRVTVDANESRVSIALAGQPVALTRNPPGSMLQRLVTAIDWRLLRGRIGRRASLDRPRLRSVSATLNIELSASEATVSIELQIDKRVLDELYLLNPGGHSLITTRSGDGAWRTMQLGSSLPNAWSRCRAAEQIGAATRHYRIHLHFSPEPDCSLESDTVEP